MVEEMCNRGCIYTETGVITRAQVGSPKLTYREDMHRCLDNNIELLPLSLVHLRIIPAVDANHNFDPMRNEDVTLGMLACEMNRARTCRQICL
jgi:hypothetical protein